MSLKLKITAWFSIMILLLTALVVTIVFIVADASLADDPVDELVKTVSMNVASLSSDKSKRDFDGFKAYHDGVYCQLFDDNYTCIEGVAPENLIYDREFENGLLTTYGLGQEEYYIYDMKVGESSWVRGYISINEPSETTKLIIISTTIILPLILVLGISGGWIIAKRSLKSIDTVVATVDSINSGDDLSKRVALQKGPSEILKLSNEFDRMSARLEKSFEAEKQFASDVSHELRTPITIALGECHNAKNIESEEERKKSISIIEKQCVKISELIDSLLSLTRLQQKTELFPLKTVNISEFATACCEEYILESGIESKETINKKSLKLDIEKNVFANYNPNLMSRIIYNLLDNANKYTGENGNIIFSLKSISDSVIIMIQDDGIGIDNENLNKIWNRFWQADKSRSGDSGVGLGLAMVKEMVEYQNGVILVESKLGNGTKFTIKLPKN